MSVKYQGPTPFQTSEAYKLSVREISTSPGETGQATFPAMGGNKSKVGLMAGLAGQPKIGVEDLSGF